MTYTAEELAQHMERETMKRHSLERIVGLPREGCYADDGSPIKCPKCGHTEFTEKMRDFIDFGVGAGPVADQAASVGRLPPHRQSGVFKPALRADADLSVRDRRRQRHVGQFGFGLGLDSCIAGDRSDDQPDRHRGLRAGQGAQHEHE